MNKKVIFSVALALFVCMGANSIPTTPQNQPSSIEIYLTTEEKQDVQTEDRSLIEVAAYYNPKSSSIDIIAIGVGDSFVTLKNSSGLIVAQTTISANDGIGLVCVPDTSDNYQLIINSTSYYSYGYFSK